MMDRIEHLLRQLCSQQSAVTGQFLRGNTLAKGKAQAARDALRQQIADEWREMVEALEMADLVLEQATVAFELQESHNVGLARMRIASVLSRVKGVIVNNPNG